MKYKKQILKLKGKTAVFIDWANVYGWRGSLQTDLDPKALFIYLSTYKKIKSINFYYGEDSNKKSKIFLNKIRKIGYTLTTKPVKYIKVGKVKSTIIKKRKCDFDIEIALDCFENLEKYNTYIFFSGDGDFATLYRRLIKSGKQVIVIYAPGHVGREIWEIQKGLFKINILNIGF